MKKMRQFKNLFFFSSGRADYGIFKKILSSLKCKNFDVFLVTCCSKTNFFLSDKNSKKINKIKKIYIKEKLENSYDLANNYLYIFKEMTKLLKKKKPKLLLVLGDRYETLAAACSSNIMQIPVVHFHGGEITYKSQDNYFRHSITKLSSLHFVSHKIYKKRVIQMGENPKKVFNIGAPGLINIDKNLLNKDQVENKLKFKLKKNFFLVTYHPETLNLKNFKKDLKNFLKGIKLACDKDTTFLFTSPGIDVNSYLISDKIKIFCKKNHNCFFVKSLGNQLYHSCLKISSGVIGNSSSGIIEAPSFNTWILNVGDRQTGRVKSKSTITIRCNTKKIFYKIQFFKKFKPKKSMNPFYKKNCMSFINKKLSNCLNNNELLTKKFYDL